MEVSKDVGLLVIGQKAKHGKVLARSECKTDDEIYSLLATSDSLRNAVRTIRLHEPRDKIVISGQTSSGQIEYDVYYHGSLMQFEHRDMSA